MRQEPVSAFRRLLLLACLVIAALSAGSAVAATIVSLFAASVTAPAGGLWLSGPTGTAGHLWVSDAALGFCRVDASLTNCVTLAKTPGQPAFDPSTSSVFVPDSSPSSAGVYRFHFNSSLEVIDSATLLRPTDGLGNNRPTAVALEPLSGGLYVGFAHTPNIVRIANPSVGVGDPKVVIGNSSDGKQTFSLAFLDLGGSVRLVEADSRGLGQILTPASCSGNCNATPMGLGITGPLSVLSSGTSLYVGDAAEVWTYDASLAASAANPSVYASALSFVSGLALDSMGNVYGMDDPTHGAVAGSGHVWRIATASAASAPTAPSAVSAIAGNAQASVSWTPPLSDGGSPITSYTVTSTPAGGSATVLAPATSATLTGLTNGTTYTFTVVATNAVGASPASAPSNSVTPATPATAPGAPTAVSATAANAQATVNWTAPLSDGGSAITSYTVTSSPAGATAAISAPAGSSLVPTTATLTGLTNGTAYNFTVTATNAAGTSASSTPSNSVTPFTVPGAPAGVTATISGSQANVTWTAPLSDGGSPITSYTVTSTPAGATATVAAPATTATVTGLTTGTAYTFTVTAANAAGSGPASAPSNSVTPSGLPAPIITANPPNPTGNPNVNFAFTSTTAGATFQCSLVPLGSADAFNPCTSPKSYGPLADATYVFKLTATDPATGLTSSPALYEFTVNTLTTPAVTAPVALPETTGHATTTGVPVTISWSATACTTGAASCNIASYHLQKSINGLAFFDVALASPTTTSILDSLTPSPTNAATVNTYRYQVQATNAQGQVSAFAVGPTFSVASTDDNGSVSYSGTWTATALAGAYGGAVHSSSTAASFATLSMGFSGTAVGLVSTLGPDRGIAQITVDGSVVASVDLYAPTLQAGQVVWSVDGLAAGVTHTFKVTVTGTHNTASTGARVDVDALVAIK